LGASVAAGLLTAFGPSRVIESQLWGISATDALTFVGVPAILIDVASVAILLPAPRASRIEPMAALRIEWFRPRPP
jgi:hypothetical protein